MTSSACPRSCAPRNKPAFAAIAAACLLLPALATAQPDRSAGPGGRYSFSVVHAFEGPSDAAYPWAGLVGAKDGDLYGTTWAGGKYADCRGGLGVGCGAIFRLDSAGTEKVIYSFRGVPGPIHLYGSLLAAGADGFYGLTNEGGTASFCYDGGAHGCGTAFHLDGKGKLTVIYNFGSNGGASDGLYPAGEPIRDTDGNLYGTTTQGGSNNNGTIFEIAKSGSESVLYRFTGGADGDSPTPSLVMDPSGNIYGTAAHGGGACDCGTVFMLAPNGAFTVLYTFQGGTDGGNPVAGLTIDNRGNLYGTAALYGNADCNNGYGCGTVFALSPGGAMTVLHGFTGKPDGMLPVSQLAIDGRGNIYGTTWLGGSGRCNSGDGCGAVFEVSAHGGERVLYGFRGGDDGIYPWGKVMLDGSGDLLGTAQNGGAADYGLVYKLTPPRR